VNVNSTNSAISNAIATQMTVTVIVTVIATQINISKRHLNHNLWNGLPLWIGFAQTHMDPRHHPFLWKAL
jgi:hypothetical protein